MAAKTAVRDFDMNVDKKNAKAIMLSPKRKKVKKDIEIWVCVKTLKSHTSPRMTVSKDPLATTILIERK